jgi:ferredoxin
MDSWIQALGWLAYACLGSAVAIFVITSLHEGRWRPVRRAMTIFTPMLGIVAALLAIDYPGRLWVVLALVGLGVSFALALALPIGQTPRLRTVGGQEQIDEREAIFHRFYRLEPNTPDFETYYSANPQKREFDDQVRALPQLASPGCHCYDPLTSPFQLALGDVLARFTRDIDWQPAPLEEAPVRVSAGELTPRIKGFARYLGADLVGTTRLNPAYVYSHIGRSPGPWGAPIRLDHTHAIVIAVEMSHRMVRHGPDGAITTETTLKYLEVGTIALVVARYIGLLGYEARAHVDGNYRVLCGPIAVDAGLGELGRIGLLITPEFGPRVRLSVVTTNLPLLQDQAVHFGAQHFCEMCRKCATCCPSASIDHGDKAVHNGVEKWRANQETCYRFWRRQGSDCGVCVKVCPYSHPSTPVHNLVRRAIRRNALARHVALWADDLFYGRRPTDRYPLPEWHARHRAGMDLAPARDGPSTG